MATNKKRSAFKVVAGTAVASRGQTKAGTDDPIWSVIAQHERVRAAYSEAALAEIAASSNIPDDVADELMAAGRSLLTTRPTTLLGTIAVLRYVGSQEDEDEVEVGHYHGRAGRVGLVLAQSLTRLTA